MSSRLINLFQVYPACLSETPLQDQLEFQVLLRYIELLLQETLVKMHITLYPFNLTWIPYQEYVQKTYHQWLHHLMVTTSTSSQSHDHLGLRLSLPSLQTRTLLKWHPLLLEVNQTTFKERTRLQPMKEINSNQKRIFLGWSPIQVIKREVIKIPGVKKRGSLPSKS